MLHRITTLEISESFIQTLTIMAASPSLCVVSYITLYKSPNMYIIGLLYALVITMTLFIYSRFPKFFSYDFHYGFAALTFPLAISCIASFKINLYLEQVKMLHLSNIIKQFGGIELFIASAVIGYVVFNYSRSFARALKVKKSELNKSNSDNNNLIN